MRRHLKHKCLDTVEQRMELAPHALACTGC